MDISLPIEEWFDEEGIDEEEIKKRILDQINQKYKKKEINILKIYYHLLKKE